MRAKDQAATIQRILDLKRQMAEAAAGQAARRLQARVLDQQELVSARQARQAQLAELTADASNASGNDANWLLWNLNAEAVVRADLPGLRAELAEREEDLRHAFGQREVWLKMQRKAEARLRKIS